MTSLLEILVRSHLHHPPEDFSEVTLVLEPDHEPYLASVILFGFQKMTRMIDSYLQNILSDRAAGV